MCNEETATERNPFFLRSNIDLWRGLELCARAEVLSGQVIYIARVARVWSLCTIMGQPELAGEVECMDGNCWFDVTCVWVGRRGCWPAVYNNCLARGVRSGLLCTLVAGPDGGSLNSWGCALLGLWALGLPRVLGLGGSAFHCCRGRRPAPSHFHKFAKAVSWKPRWALPYLVRLRL